MMDRACDLCHEQMHNLYETIDGQMVCIDCWDLTKYDYDDYIDDDVPETDFGNINRRIL